MYLYISKKYLKKNVNICSHFFSNIFFSLTCFFYRHFMALKSIYVDNIYQVVARLDIESQQMSRQVVKKNNQLTKISYENVFFIFKLMNKCIFTLVLFAINIKYSGRCLMGLLWDREKTDSNNRLIIISRIASN